MGITFEFKDLSKEPHPWSDKHFDEKSRKFVKDFTWEDLNWWKSDQRTLTEVLATKDAYLPHADRWYRALGLTPFKDVKVVILGQDPYHTPGVANGLAFSTNPDIRVLPPSLRNIFSEYTSDLKLPTPRNGDLSHWGTNGVLLLNTALTVEPHKPASHKDIGWNVLTEEVLTKLNEETKHSVFILWGKHAHQYHHLIHAKRHLVIRSPHPSPFSARQGFFGSRPFSRANAYLEAHGRGVVDWRLS